MIVHYPGKLKDPGTVRSQFHHVCDIAPTIYELAKVPAPTTVDGTKQTPLAGISMAYTFSDPDAADKRTTQYFDGTQSTMMAGSPQRCTVFLGN